MIFCFRCAVLFLLYFLISFLQFSCLSCALPVFTGTFFFFNLFYFNFVACFLCVCLIVQNLCMVSVFKTFSFCVWQCFFVLFAFSFLFVLAFAFDKVLPDEY